MDHYLDNHPDHPANQEPQEEQPTDELFNDMCEFLDESGSNIYLLGLDKNGWYYTREEGDKETKHRLPVKFWIVAK